MEKVSTPHKEPRAPVVAVMGHIDHGKSTLLDYIRKSRTVEGEAGGITQHLSAYEVLHKDKAGVERPITFLDTPGHEAFQSMRQRGATVADIVILVVSAEDGVKAQTLEALKAIHVAHIPYIVAINKIDKPNADIERTKMNLLEKEVYLEGLGGDIPFVPISAKTGEGIDELLDMMLLVADLGEFTHNPDEKAEGIVIEAHRDPKRGIAATLLIKNGALKAGEYVAAGSAVAPLRIVLDFMGNKLEEASASSPVTVIGFSDVPEIGSPFLVTETKKEAEAIAYEYSLASIVTENSTSEEPRIVVPVIIKADALGSIEAIKHELSKIDQERILLKVVHAGVGDINESDVQRAVTDAQSALVVGFGVGVDSVAREIARRDSIALETFNIIYELAQWLSDEAKKQTPLLEVEKVLSRSKILKVFSSQRNTYVLGGRVEEGELIIGDQLKLMRGEEELCRGNIHELQQSKSPVKSVKEGNEFGAQIELKVEPLPADKLITFEVTEE